MLNSAQLAFLAAADKRDEQACLIALENIETFDNVSIRLDRYFCATIHKVAKNGLTNVLSKMLERGFTVTQVDSTNQNAVHIALCNGYYAFAKMIAEAKPELCKIVDLNGMTPLLLAARYGQDNLVRLCIAQGMDVNATCWKDQQTPLHFAAMGGHASTVNVLFELGAHARVYNISNHLPSIVCRVSKHELYELLLSKENDIPLFERCALATAQFSVPTEALPEVLVEQQQAIVIRHDAQQKQKAENKTYWNSLSEEANVLWEQSILKDTTEALDGMKLAK